MGGTGEASDRAAAGTTDESGTTDVSGTTERSGVTVDEVVVPESADAEGAADFIATVDIRNAVEADGYGTRDVEVTLAHLLAIWQNPAEPQRLLLGRLDGRPVGRAYYQTSPHEGFDTAWAGVQVLPDARGRGVGTALADAVEAIARDEGRRKVIVYAVSPDGPGERLDAPTGSGSVPADNPEVRFLLARGYRLEQVSIGSRMPLPLDAQELASRLMDARLATGSAYRLHHWEGPIPERWRADMLHLHTRTSVDEPSAGLEEPEDAVDADRMDAAEAEVAASGNLSSVVAAEHVSGRLIGFSELSIPDDTARVVQQWDTIVLEEHRGHGLGMLLKLANLEHLQAEHPGHPSILTWNAAENRHMLRVNDALGFEPMGVEGGWRLDLRP
jgi:GNAT superfamily N-acetyltransferase